MHDNQDEMKMDSFEFEVTDGFNPVTRTFRWVGELPLCDICKLIYPL